MIRTAKFWDRMATGYVRSPIKDDELYPKKLKLSRALISNPIWRFWSLAAVQVPLP
jgi:hypothetical protein